MCSEKLPPKAVIASKANSRIKSGGGASQAESRIFVAEPVLGPALGRTRGLLAMTVFDDTNELHAIALRHR